MSEQGELNSASLANGTTELKHGRKKNNRRKEHDTVAITN